jgi:signal transduction histidine kinase/CheY-like chemotaxis protein
VSPFGPASRVEALLAVLERMAAGELELRAPISSAHDELDAVAHGVNVLVGELRDTAVTLQRAKEEAESANQAKTTFLRNVSHELRTPLSAMLGAAQLLGAPELGEARREELLARIQANGQALRELLDELLDLSKVEAGKLEVELQACSARDAVDEVLADLAPEAARKGLQLRALSAPGAPSAVEADPRRVRQILLNLVGNALKFTERGAVEVRLSGEADGKLAIDVADTGIGLDPAQAAALFAPFQQADATIAPRFGGTGLGLALSRRLAELMGGGLRLLHSAPGQGACFRLTLRAREALVRVPRVTPVSLGSAPLLGLRLLLAEDSADIREVMTDLLSLSGAEVVGVEDGEAAVARVLAERFDLVLMDVRMPRLDGLEATRRLRAAGARLPILALTADAVREHQEDCLRAGCDAYVPKPADIDRLVAEVARHCGRAAITG